MAQENVAKSKQTTAPEETVTEAAQPNAELDQEVEDLLADIDEVLEENAEKFVQSYVQKGGE